MIESAPNAEVSFDPRFLRKGKHSALLYLPPTYHAPIGAVIAYWGQFEETFNVCLASLIEGEKEDGGTRDTEDWRSNRFKSRRRLFKEICAEWLATWRPDEAATLALTADTAGDLAWKRNLIAHGAYVYTIPAHSAVATNCHALNRETGDKFYFDETVLKKLYHDISHLTGDLLITFGRFSEIQAPFPALPDTQLLQAYRESSRLQNPTSDKPPPPPESSPQ